MFSCDFAIPHGHESQPPGQFPPQFDAFETTKTNAIVNKNSMNNFIFERQKQ